MTEKKLPEVELAHLYNKLAGNEAFGRLRGRFPKDLGVMGAIIAAADSPSDFCRRWDEFTADARVLGNLLACYKRDCSDVAANELSRALQDSAYRFPDETLPIHEIQPVTVVVFDFPRTLTLIRWLRCGKVLNIAQYLDEPNGPWGWDLTDRERADYISQVKKERDDFLNGAERDLTISLFSDFPVLEQIMFSSKSVLGVDIAQAYRDIVLDKFDRQGLEAIGRPLGLSYRSHAPNFSMAVFDTDGKMSVPFGYLCLADQAEVLSRYSREQQKDIATWTMKMPKSLSLKEFDKLFAGFHAEESHAGWSQNHSYAASLGCSHGYRAVIMQKPFAVPSYHHTTKFHRGFFDRHVELKNADEKLAFELEVRPE